MLHIHNMVKQAEDLLDKLYKQADSPEDIEALARSYGQGYTPPETVQQRVIYHLPAVDKTKFYTEAGLNALSGVGFLTGIGGILHHLLTSKKNEEGEVEKRTFMDYLPWLLASGGGLALGAFGPKGEMNWAIKKMKILRDLQAQGGTIIPRAQ